MNPSGNCECVSWLGVFLQKITDLWHEVDDIMAQNAAVNNVENNQVQTVTDKERKMFAVAMHHLPLFQDGIKENKLSISTRTTANSFENAKKSLEEYKQLLQQRSNIKRDFIQLKKSDLLSSQNVQDDLKDSVVKYAEDREWEIIGSDENAK